MVSVDSARLQYLYPSSDYRSLHVHLLSRQTAVMSKKANSAAAVSALADTTNLLLLQGVTIDVAKHPIVSGTNKIETDDDRCTLFVS